MQRMLSFWNLSTCCFGSLRLDRLHPDKVSRNRKVRGKFVTGGVCRNRNWRCSCWTRTSCSSCRQLLKDFTIYKNTLRCCAVAVAMIKRSRVQILLCSSLFTFLLSCLDQVLKEEEHFYLWCEFYLQKMLPCCIARGKANSVWSQKNTPPTCKAIAHFSVYFA